MHLPLRKRKTVPPPPPPELEWAEAEEFITGYYREHPMAGDRRARLDEVRASIAETGTYRHTLGELTHAARVAWRHSARCAGRYTWRTLRVRDRRDVRDPDKVAAEVVEHLHKATNGGRVRSYITVFAPDSPDHAGPRIWNTQVIRYAGYRRPAGGFIGDPANVALTDLATSFGWQADGGAFDVLPLVVQDQAEELHVFPLPSEAVLEVPVTHPDFSWFAELGLRWYAVPLISDMYLDAGGIRYPCAPFNGWYQASSEVGVRDLGDEGRYNMLPTVAAGMGLDTSRVDTMWQDRAAVELAIAAHHSYRQAGVMVTDHQSESRRFMKFVEAEENAGRPWCADWSWVNPPLSASTTPVFHRTYPDEVLKPGYFRHESPWSAPGCPWGKQ